MSHHLLYTMTHHLLSIMTHHPLLRIVGSCSVALIYCRWVELPSFGAATYIPSLVLGA